MEHRSRYLITGATGLIGSALVKTIVSENVEIICPVRNLDKAKEIFDPQVFDEVKWVEAPMEEYLKSLSGRVDYVIHCASPTASKFFVDYPVETLSFNINTTSSLLDFARRNTIKSMVYLSSIESYGTVLDDTDPISEDYQGYVNPMETRSSYNMAKRVCESLCHAYATEYGVPVKVIRLTQTISPLINSDDMRVFAQFARQASRGEDIELHTEGTSSRQYIHIDDAVSAVLCVLNNGIPGQVYNAAREDSYISVKDMAQFVQEQFNPHGKVVIRLKDDMGYAPTTKLKLSTKKLKSLGWEPQYDLFAMFQQLIDSLRK